MTLRIEQRNNPKYGPANACVYRGTAGIAWFLLEAYNQTQDQKYAQTASGALRYAIDAVRSEHATISGFGSQVAPHDVHS